MNTKYKTITFNEDSNGWTSFWDYEPLECFSVNGRFYTCNLYNLWEHYDVSGASGNNLFYNERVVSEVTLVLNDNPSCSKSFRTLNYEGSDGWTVESIKSSEGSNNYNGSSFFSNDTSYPITSYSEGLILENGVEYRSGFYRKEDKYFANILNNSVTLREGEVNSGSKTSGVKGFFVEIKIKTDSTTNIDGVKQLFSVSSNYSKSFI